MDTKNYLNDILNELKASSDKEVCPMCGGTGRSKNNPYKCDYCGKEYIGNEASDYMTIPDIYIPIKYKSNYWEYKKIFEKLNTMLKNKQLTRQEYDMFIQNMITPMGSILKKVKDGTQLNKSLIICSPKGFSKRCWIYTLMYELSNLGLSIAPLQNIVDFPMFNNEDMDKYLLPMVLSNFDVANSLEKLSYIIDRRELQDKPTVVISDLPYTYLNSKYNANLRLDWILEGPMV